MVNGKVDGLTSTASVGGQVVGTEVGVPVMVGTIVITAVPVCAVSGLGLRFSNANWKNTVVGCESTMAALL